MDKPIKENFKGNLLGTGGYYRECVKYIEFLEAQKERANPDLKYNGGAGTNCWIDDFDNLTQAEYDALAEIQANFWVEAEFTRMNDAEIYEYFNKIFPIGTKAREIMIFKNLPMAKQGIIMDFMKDRVLGELKEDINPKGNEC